MATPFYQGKDLRISYNGKVLYHTTECGFSISANFEEIATKDTDGTNTVPGEYTWSMTAASLIANKPTATTDKIDCSDLITSILEKKKFKVEFTTAVTGDIVLSGDIYVESVSVSAAVGQIATGDFSFKGDGTLTLKKVEDVPDKD